MPQTIKQASSEDLTVAHTILYVAADREREVLRLVVITITIVSKSICFTGESSLGMNVSRVRPQWHTQWHVVGMSLTSSLVTSMTYPALKTCFCMSLAWSYRVSMTYIPLYVIDIHAEVIPTMSLSEYVIGYVGRSLLCSYCVIISNNYRVCLWMSLGMSLGMTFTKVNKYVIGSMSLLVEYVIGLNAPDWRKQNLLCVELQ
jgi:hypothetical protein